jgi:hypothetical protein
MMGWYGVSALAVSFRLIVGRIGSGGSQGVLRIGLQFVNCRRLV